MNRKRKCEQNDIEEKQSVKKSKTSSVNKTKKINKPSLQAKNHDIQPDNEVEENYFDEHEFSLYKVEDILSQYSGVSDYVAKNFVKLIEDDNTLPFIARYRKSLVNHMTPESLQDLFECYSNLCNLRKKACNVLKTLKKNGKLTRDLETSILSARSTAELDLLYEPLKERSGTLADRARELGLEKAANALLDGKYVDLNSLCNPTVEGLKTVSDVEMNLINLLADIIYRDSRVLEKIRSLKEQTSMYVESSQSNLKSKVKKELKNSSKGKQVDADKYRLYFDFKLKVEYMKPHQILALNRGEAEKVLTIKIIIPDWFLNNLERFCSSVWKAPMIKIVVQSAYKRLIKPWLTRRIRSELTTKAEKESVSVFASNLKRLLMTSPIKGHNILGIDPGFKAGCKIGIIDSSGQVLETSVLYPKFQTSTQFDGECAKIQQFIETHRCGVIALGNGTGCREMESWLKKWKVSDRIPLVIVPEQGASIYSCSPEAAKEHPGMDPNLISAISIARRALDPLSELVKVEPKHVGVGLYQHDIPAKLLSEVLNKTVVNCASFVGADLNTASVALLRKIAGLTETKAKAIIKYREKNGSFKCREELLKVTGIGPKIFKQCAGFLRVTQGSNKLDNTWIHPESYDIALKLLKEFKLSKNDIGSKSFVDEFRSKTSFLNMQSLSIKFNCLECDIQLIVEALSQTFNDDPLRNNKPIYSISVNNINQLKLGSILTGVVSNVTPFGCFVDCGVGRDGLIHTSQMGGSRIPQLGERVKVMIIPPLTEKIRLKLEEIVLS